MMARKKRPCARLPLQGDSFNQEGVNTAKHRLVT